MTRQGPSALDRASGVPLWAQLRDDLVARVERGDFPDRFPGEMELVEVYAVSRHTVREALRHLRRDGVIESSRGRSSVANPGQITQQLGAMYSLYHELESRGIDQRSEVVDVGLREDPEVATRLGLVGPLVHVERVRLADGEPIAWDRAWLDPEVGKPLLDADLSHTGLYDELRRTTGIRLTGGRETMRAVVPTLEQRKRLRMPRGEAAMLVERTGRLGDRVVELRETLVRGTRFSFAAEWSADRAYQVDIAP
jgi:GntR family transcriptional regulator